MRTALCCFSDGNLGFDRVTTLAEKLPHAARRHKDRIAVIARIDYPSNVGGWFGIVLLVGMISVGFVVTRLVRSRRSSDLGEVSQNWLTEQRAKKQSDR